MDKYVIIIGAMKSGTTTLFELLAAHPKIAPASPKEPGFFAFDELWQQGYDWYHRLFDFDPAHHSYRLEASTDYTKAPFVTDIWDRMRASPHKKFKLIYIMRDPVKRLESHARHTQKTRKELGQQISPRPDHSLDAGLSQISLAASQYAYQLDQFTEAHAQGDLHVMSFEALRLDPKASMAAVFDFLGLESDFQSEELPRHNIASERKETLALWTKLSRNKPLMAIGRTLLPQTLREKIKGIFRRKIRVTGRFEFTPLERQAAYALLRDDIARLPLEYGLEAAELWHHPQKAQDATKL